MSLNLDIIAYDDHLHFLRDFMKAKKEKNPSFSIEVFARQLNLKNKSILAMCLTGARFPNQQLIDNISDYLELDEDRRKYFQRLVIVKKLEKEGADQEIIRTLIQKPQPQPFLMVHDRRLEELKDRINKIENDIRSEFHDLNGQIKIELKLEYRQINN